MKGKKILSLVSLAMGVAIVGGTFAAWAVTDNADPFGIKVSPGSVGPDTTQFVTLSYGSSTFANVDNLEAGVPRIAGNVLLKADTNDGKAFPYALFDIKLEDQTAGTKGAGEAALVNLLKVDVYDKQVQVVGNVVKDMDGKDVTPIGHIPTEDMKLNASVPVTIPSGTGLTVYVVVSLDANTDAKVLEQIASDVVYLQMNLNKQERSDYVTASKLYLNKIADEGYDMYCYAWDAKNKNAAWPGIKMTAENGASVYELNNEFDKLVFNMSKKVGEEWQTGWQTVDLDVTEAIRTTTPTFTPNNTAGDDGKFSGSWGAAPDPEIVAGYYVVSDKEDKGNFFPVKNCLMTVDTSNAKHFTKSLTFVAGEKFKVCNQNRTVWFSSLSTWDDCGFTIDPIDGNVVVTNAGTYTVNLYTEGDGGNCVTLGLPVKA